MAELAKTQIRISVTEAKNNISKILDDLSHHDYVVVDGKSGKIRTILSEPVAKKKTIQLGLGRKKGWALSIDEENWEMNEEELFDE